MGGVERSSCNLANSFAELGYEVYYLALIPKEKFYDLNFNIRYIEPLRFNLNKISVIKTFKYLRGEIKSINPDVILTFTKFYSGLANLALLGTKYGVIVTERSSPIYKWPKHIQLFSKLAFRLKTPKGVISQTSIASSYHKFVYPKVKHFAVIHNPLRFIKEYPEVNREKILLAVGRFNDSCKGFDLLIEAFNEIEDKEWRLVFAGGTKDEGKYLLDLANDTIKDRIDFLGKIKNIDIEYAKAGIFVMPSRSEGFPNALVEAMAAGCPCISFDFIAGPRDVITERENGILIPAERVDLLAKAIDELIANSELRNKISLNALAIKTKLEPKKIAKQYLIFFENVKIK